jgi:hypothetical protein
MSVYFILRSTIGFSFDLFWAELDLILLHITSLAISMAAFVHTVESAGFFLVVAIGLFMYGLELTELNLSHQLELDLDLASHLSVINQGSPGKLPTRTYLGLAS